MSMTAIALLLMPVASAACRRPQPLPESWLLLAVAADWRRRAATAAQPGVPARWPAGRAGRSRPSRRPIAPRCGSGCGCHWHHHPAEGTRSRPCVPWPVPWSAVPFAPACGRGAVTCSIPPSAPGTPAVGHLLHLPGYEGYEGHEILRDFDDPGHLLVVSRWTSQDRADAVMQDYAAHP